MISTGTYISIEYLNDSNLIDTCLESVFSVSYVLWRGVVTKFFFSFNT